MSRSTLWTVTDPVYVHKFPEPFKAHEETVDELPIRKPTGLDMIEVGSPVVFDSDTGKAELDVPKSYAMLSRLSNMPSKVLAGIDPGEMLDLFWMVASFFMRGRQTLLPALQSEREASSARVASPGHSPAASTPASP